MRHAIPILLIAILDLLLPACGSKRQEKAGDDITDNESRVSTFHQPRHAEHDEPSIGPNRCRLIGTVVAIDSSFKSADPADPCAKAPCRATVRVESVLGYGPAFLQPLANGQLIPVTFAFTLSPTQNLVLNMTSSYPGLGVGAKFLAEVEANAEPEMGETKPVTFVIYEYEVK